MALTISMLPVSARAERGKCGDGVCDDFEKRSGRCPRDCGNAPGMPQQTPAISPPEIAQESTPKDLPSAIEHDGFSMGFMEISSIGVEGRKKEELDYVLELRPRIERKAFWYIRGDFQEMGTPAADLLNNGIEVIANIQPMPAGPPDDYDNFKSKLKSLLRGYKKSIKYWQIGNEPDLAWAKRGYSSEDYVRYFLAASPIIREECPDCKIVLAGVSNQYDSGDNYEFFRRLLEGIRKGSLGSKPFDVFDVHIYTDDKDYKRAVKAVRDYKKLLLDTGYDYAPEFISTEFGTYSGKPNTKTPQGGEISYQSEEEQARMLVKLYVGFFRSGVTKALWASLVNNYKFGFQGSEGGYFDLTGLLYNGKGSYDLERSISFGAKKKAYYAYKVLASKIQGKTKCEEVSETVFKFSKGNDLVYVAWGQAAAELPLTINGPMKVTDYLGKESIKDASEIALTDSPLFIEPLN